MSKLDRFKRQGARRGRADTDAEQVLWDNLYRIPLEGTHFRRQVEIGLYRADFGSLRLKLLIEIDGLIHQQPAQKNTTVSETSGCGMKGIGLFASPTTK